jgi:hypothetical protein
MQRGAGEDLSLAKREKEGQPEPIVGPSEGDRTVNPQKATEKGDRVRR